MYLGNIYLWEVQQPIIINIANACSQNARSDCLLILSASNINILTLLGCDQLLPYVPMQMKSCCFFITSVCFLSVCFTSFMSDT